MLKEKFKFELFPEKTLITKIKEKLAQFLGFTFWIENDKHRKTVTLYKGKKNNPK